MSLTPVEIKHVHLGRRPLGYERKATDRLLEEIAASFEHVWRERADLRDELERVEDQLQHHRETEESLRNTLVSAERMADEVRFWCDIGVESWTAYQINSAHVYAGDDDDTKRLKTYGARRPDNSWKPWAAAVREARA